MAIALFAAQSSYMPGVQPAVQPRMSAPLMEMTDPRFPAAGKGVLADGSPAAIPFLVTPSHLLATDYAGNAVRQPFECRRHCLRHEAAFLKPQT